MTGFFKGFVRMVFGLMGMLGGIVLSVAFARPLGVYIGQVLGFTDYFIGKILAFVFIFFISAMCGFVFAYFLKRMVDLANLGFIDRFIGGAFGFIQGIIFSGVILTVLYLIPSSQPWVKQSVIGSNMVAVAVVSAKTLPEEWIEYVSPDRWIGASRKNILHVLQNGSAQPENNDEQADSDSTSG